jgi:hypothetical protein
MKIDLSFNTAVIRVSGFPKYWELQEGLLSSVSSKHSILPLRSVVLMRVSRLGTANIRGVRREYFHWPLLWKHWIGYDYPRYCEHALLSNRALLIRFEA